MVANFTWFFHISGSPDFFNNSKKTNKQTNKQNPSISVHSNDSWTGITGIGAAGNMSIKGLATFWGESTHIETKKNVYYFIFLSYTSLQSKMIFRNHRIDRKKNEHIILDFSSAHHKTDRPTPAPGFGGASGQSDQRVFPQWVTALGRWVLLKQLLDLPSHGLFYVTVVMSTSRPWESWKSLRGTCYLIVFLFFFFRFFSRVVSSLFLQGWGTLTAGMIWFSAVIEACGSDLVCQKNTDSIQLQHSLSFSPSSLKLHAFMTTKQGTLMSGGFGRIKTS